MTVAATATTRTKKLMKLTLSLFRRGFNSSKCKTAAKMAVARIKLLRNKRQVVVRQMRRDIAMLLQSGQDATARIRVEHVIREQNVLAANEFIELFCELVVARLSIIGKQRECPPDLKEGIASLIFAAPRCSEIPELVALRDVFEKKYGKDFVSSATDLRPSCGVNRMLIDKLSVRTPTGEVKLKIMKEIAKEYQVEWDTTESETELLKPPEELIEGPKSFASATSLPMNPTPTVSDNYNRSIRGSATSLPLNPTATVFDNHNRSIRSSGETDPAYYHDMASAAAAAAESAKQAIAAAQAAAYMANKNSNHSAQVTNHSNVSYTNHGFETHSGYSTGLSMPKDPPNGSHNGAQLFEAPGRLFESESFGGSHHLNGGAQQFQAPGRLFESQSFGGSHHLNESNGPPDVIGRHVPRRHSYNAPSAHSDIKFDESDDDEEIDIDEPPNQPPPPVPSSRRLEEESPGYQVHPKLPNYDELSARFEALKSRKSLP